MYWKVRLMGEVISRFCKIHSLHSSKFRSCFLGKSYPARHGTNIFQQSSLVPVANLLVFGSIPLSDEGHRYALAAGNLAMLGVSLFLGNPNKILVYTTTLPRYFVAHILLFNAIIRKSPGRRKPPVILAIADLRHFLLRLTNRRFCDWNTVTLVSLKWYYGCTPLFGRAP